MEKFRFSRRDEAVLQLESEFMETLKELNLLIDAGRVSHRDARALIGSIAATKVAVSLHGSVDEIERSVNTSRYSRLNMQKKRLAWEAGKPDLADRHNEEMVRNRILPDLMQRMAAGESKEDLIDSLRYDAKLSEHTMERIEAGLSHFAEVARIKAAL